MQINNLQIAPNGVCPIVHASQYDKGRQIKFLLFDGSVAYTPPTGATVKVEGIKPDKHGFSYECSWSGNEVTVVLTEQMTVLEGEVDCELRVMSSDNIDIGSLNFRLLVEKSPINDETLISETEIPTIIALATEQEQNAEAWAVGERGGVPVPDTDETYHNNAKYYAEQAGGGSGEAHEFALQAEAWAVGERDGVPVPNTDETHHNNSKYYAGQSSDSATASSNSATAASSSARDAQNSKEAAKLSEQNAKASEDILQFYVDFEIPRFVIQNNRLYISDPAQGEFIVANNRLYIKIAS